MHAWTGYKKYAWGSATLDPVKNTSNKNGWNPFGGSKCGATIIDSLDTLHIMGFQEEYILGRDWLVENFEQTFLSTTGKASVFELTIRYLGGFLQRSTNRAMSCCLRLKQNIRCRGHCLVRNRRSTVTGGGQQGVVGFWRSWVHWTWNSSHCPTLLIIQNTKTWSTISEIE